MLGNMHRNKSVDVHKFSMVPKADVPRSKFKRPSSHKTTFQAGYLVPIFVDEVVPGDHHYMNATFFGRMSTPIYPIMDNLHLETFFFFVPMRLVWLHYDKFFGAQENPTDSVSFTIPTMNVSASTNIGSLADYFGIPASNLTAGGSITVNALPFRAYNLIWNLWFRDENLQNSVGYGSANGTSQWTNMDDGPDPNTNYTLLKRGKKADYFTTCLPWTQKGGQVQLPLTGNATVKTAASALFTGSQNAVTWLKSGGGNLTGNLAIGGNATNQLGETATATATPGSVIYPSNLYADLTTVTATTINSLRLAITTQRVLERDARGGTRYQEKTYAHFGVMGADARLMRPEYLGGSTQPINIQPVPQTGPTGTTGSTTPLGALAAIGHVTARCQWSQSFTEHGYIIGLANVRADLNYQQGLRRLWTRSTQYDHYLPDFAWLGEQAVRNDEIYAAGSNGPAGQDAAAFGYNARWEEYRYFPTLISGAFRSTYTAPLDSWHLAEKFTALPTLSSAFIQSSSDIVVRRAIAAGAAADNEQIIFDAFYDIESTRPMPMYSIPGWITRF